MQASAVMCIQDFVELLIADIQKMSEKEKLDLRRGIQKAFRMKIAAPKIGQYVIVQMNDGRKVEAVVKAVHQTTEGEKVQVAFGNITMKVGVEQILKQQ